VTWNSKEKIKNVNRKRLAAQRQRQAPARLHVAYRLAAARDRRAVHVSFLHCFTACAWR